MQARHAAAVEAMAAGVQALVGEGVKHAGATLEKAQLVAERLLPRTERTDYWTACAGDLLPGLLLLLAREQRPSALVDRGTDELFAADASFMVRSEVERSAIHAVLVARLAERWMRKGGNFHGL